LLLHQGNRTRHSWNDLAEQLAAAGINTLTLDMRGYGESGGKHQNWPREDTPVKQIWADDIDAAWKYLTAQQGVNGEVIGLGGAGYSVSITRS
jgi:alpha-beta hydrolase superfamily lysophospholipase